MHSLSEQSGILDTGGLRRTGVVGMSRTKLGLCLTAMVAVLASTGCRNHMPHAFTWAYGGDVQQSHAKPPGAHYKNWDPYAYELRVEPLEAVNPVQTQHLLIATVLDDEGKPLPNRRVEWMLEGVGHFVEVDEHGWRHSRGFKVDGDYAITHTQDRDNVITMGNDDPSDDITIEKGSTWVVITSPVEGDSHVTAYAPGIYDWDKHKVFVQKHWYDVAWQFPPSATNPVGTEHMFTTNVMKHSDGTPLEGYLVTYTILDGPAAAFASTGGQTTTVTTGPDGTASVTLRQQTPAEGTNNVEIDIMRPADLQCCKPAVHISTGATSKTWIGPKIGITKDAPAREMVNNTFQYTINVNNPSQVAATNVVVTDMLPDGIQYVSSTPSAQNSGQGLTWQLGSLAAGASTGITVNVQGTRTGTFDNCADVNADFGLQDRDCAQTIIVAPALVIEKQCTPMVTVCDPIEYVITVRNTGDGPANNVVVRENLPSGITTQSGNTGLASAPFTLNAGESKQFRFTAKADGPGSYTNTATAEADGGLTAEDSCTTVVSQPVLTVSKTAPDLRYIGRNIEYSITVTNSSDVEARNTVLTDNLPSGAQFVSASDGGSGGGNVVTWNLGTLAAGASRTVSLTVRPNQRGTYRNEVTARAFCAEASDSAVTEVRGIPAILLEVVDNPDPIELGTNVTYTIRVTNQGSADDTNIRVEAIIPGEGEYVTASGPTNGQTDGQTVRFDALPLLAPKAVATYTITVKANAEGDVRFKVSMISENINSPVEETESTRFYR
jgi:uncharacterized repeat protein (TIGR01451 family)